jgi:hypothetical protein
MLRFVILHHTGIDAPHFDFLFEMEPDALLTSFRCPTWPPLPGDVWEEMPEHRRDYLEYEGPVSGHRGDVRRIDAGTINHVVLATDPPTLGVALEAIRPLDISIAHAFEPGVDSATRWRVQTVEPLGDLASGPE